MEKEIPGAPGVRAEIFLPNPRSSFHPFELMNYLIESVAAAREEFTLAYLYYLLLEMAACAPVEQKLRLLFAGISAGS